MIASIATTYHCGFQQPELLQRCVPNFKTIRLKNMFIVSVDRRLYGGNVNKIYIDN